MNVVFVSGISSLIPKDGMKVLLDLIISGPDDKCE
jgi:hypothetical protein